ncbi:hypothetical protein THL1_3096 [Pseudomonas sp. TCU-HL1]|nr:hypothetical protein THL1_3059 [Pseudomonas sp. TCU-HL1]AOE85619.1 hypothetical protein THL1_3071 [Pseudomonas sp. TCU-HL1]AOE85632.1 hypothetical protein THL1_3084 [Pseudomonas sp. TCU-HL1]AOE85644.1 hypothetical protein THL1_3096 [Pseudomonas sp. TCU-HL1]
MSLECDDCGEEFEEDDPGILVEDGEQLCPFCNSEESD